MIKIITILITISGLILVLYMLFSKSQKPWSEMTQNEKNRKKMVITGGALVFLAGLLSLLSGRKK
jgi:uncharacterized membrane protein YfcA